MENIAVAKSNIKKARIELGYSQLELAKLLQVSQQVISAYEQGTRMPSLQIAVKLSEILKKDFNDLFLN